MSESKHTPEPWIIRAGTPVPLYSLGPDHPAAPFAGTAQGEANAARIVACVNGCAGINPEAVPDLLAAAVAVVNIASGISKDGIGPCCYVAPSLILNLQQAIVKAKFK